jgi:hypothetical protein
VWRGHSFVLSNVSCSQDKLGANVNDSGAGETGGGTYLVSVANARKHTRTHARAKLQSLMFIFPTVDAYLVGAWLGWIHRATPDYHRARCSLMCAVARWMRSTHFSILPFTVVLWLRYSFRPFLLQRLQ